MGNHPELQRIILRLVKDIPGFTVRLLFPPKCIFCSELLGPGTIKEVCCRCFNEIPFINNHRDFTEKFLSGTDGSSIWFDDVFPMCEYEGIIKESIMRYKYFGKTHYYKTYAAIMVDRYKKIFNTLQFDLIIGIPLYKDRERERGYNQSVLLSKEISRATGIPDKSGFLIRNRYTDTQSLLDKSERYLNVKDAFGMTNKKGVKGKSVLLVDDVLTTGYTVNECSKILKKSGAIKVYVITIAAALRI